VPFPSRSAESASVCLAPLPPFHSPADSGPLPLCLSERLSEIDTVQNLALESDHAACRTHHRPIRDFPGARRRSARRLGPADPVSIGNLPDDPVENTPINGGDGSSGIRGTNSLQWQVSAAELTRYNGNFVTNPGVCALSNWQFSPIYPSSGMGAGQLAQVRAFDNRADVKAALQAINDAAKARPYMDCRRH
jgi:hypothetical protein